MNTNGKGIAYTLIGGICWGVAGIIGKLLFDEKGLTAQWLVTARLLFGGLIMLCVAFYGVGSGIFKVWRGKRTAGSLLVFALFGMMFCQLSYYMCIQYSNPATATVLQYTSPVLIMLLSLFTERKLPQIREVVVLFVVIAGVFLMATHGDIHSLAISEKALILGGISALTVVVYTMWPTRLLKTYGSAMTVGWGMFVGGVILLPFSRFWEVPGRWDGYTVLWTAFVVVIGTACSFGFYLKGVMYLGPVKGSLLACVEPLVSTVLTVVVLQECFAAADFIGIAAIILGVTALAVADNMEERK